MPLSMLIPSSTKCWRNLRLWPRTAAGRCDGTQATSGWSGVAQGRHGDLVCRLLRHAVAGDRPAVRDPLRYAVWAVRALDPAWPVAPLARAAAPPLAPGLWRRAGAECGGDRQSLLSLGAKLLCARHRWRQEDLWRQDPARRGEVRHPSGDRCRTGEPP